ncbi:MAG: thioredoxin family protein [Puniceicoccales bacterium]|nr:thioredoxin family protein [Puniceicoccales bacterium]
MLICIKWALTSDRVQVWSTHRIEETQVENLRQEDFPRFIADNKVALVDFHATWCGPCRAMEHVIEALRREFSGIAGIAKVDVDESPGLAKTFGIQAIPTIILFKDGKLVEQLSGSRTQDELAQKLQTLS